MGVGVAVGMEAVVPVAVGIAVGFSVGVGIRVAVGSGVSATVGLGVGLAVGLGVEVGMGGGGFGVGDPFCAAPVKGPVEAAGDAGAIVGVVVVFGAVGVGDGATGVSPEIAGALAVTKRGAIPSLPTREEVRALSAQAG